MQDRVYRAKVRDVDDLKQRLIDEWDSLEPSVIDNAINHNQWRSRLRACDLACERGGGISNSLFTCNLPCPLTPVGAERSGATGIPSPSI